MSDLRIVVGTDGSPSALDAVDWAADEAARRDVPLRVVHVSVWGQYGPSGGELKDPVTETALDRVARRRPTVEVSTDVILGDPAPALLAQSDTAGILILGSRGLGRAATALLGSVSLPVVTGANCPVVVVRRVAKTSAYDERPVLVGVGGQGSGAPVRFAFEEAAARRCPVRALHAWFVPRVEAATAHTGHFDDARHARAAGAEEVLDDAVREIATDFPGVPLQRVLGEGPVADSLLEGARDASMMVIGTHRRRSFGPRLGPVNHAMLHHAPCPVAVVPLV